MLFAPTVSTRFGLSPIQQRRGLEISYRFVNGPWEKHDDLARPPDSSECCFLPFLRKSILNSIRSPIAQRKGGFRPPLPIGGQSKEASCDSPNLILSGSQAWMKDTRTRSTTIPDS